MWTARPRALYIAIRIGLALAPAAALAHGVAGQRFFPTTFAVDDPFMNDELSLLAHSGETNGGAGEPSTRTTSLALGYSKTILPGFGLELEGQYLWLHARGDGTASGFDNLGAALKYQFLTSDAHELILSAGVSSEIGGTGSARVGAGASSTISPALFFGKGLGDLPPSLGFLRPVAFTGAVGPTFPLQQAAGAESPTMLTWAFTVQYSLMYLQSAVKDVGLGAPWNRLVAVVELPLQTCLNTTCAGQTTGFVNPGIAWVGKYMELGAAAEIPLSPASGSGVGVFALLHLFIDDLLPRSVGRPIFP